jgi:predicted permease
MEIIGEWLRRIRYLLQRRRFDEELRREMEAHRELLKDPRTFGNTLRLRDEARDAWGWTWLDDLLHDARLGMRTLRRSPGFTFAAIVTLALGIGVNLGIFRLVDALLLRPLYERPEGVVEVHSRAPAPPGGYTDLSYPNYRDLRDGASGIFENVAAVATEFVALDSGEGSRRALASAVTADYFRIFRTPLAFGRPFTLEEEQPGSSRRVVIVSYRFWERRGVDPNVLGQTVQINGDPFAIVGVAAKGFVGTSLPGPEIWLPLGADDVFRPRAGSSRRPLTARDAHELSVVGRLRDGRSIESAAAVLAVVSQRLEQAFPDVNAGHVLSASAAERAILFLPGAGRRAMMTLALLLMVMPAIVLLVTCLNLANLLLARGQGRRREMAIRSSLGGGRWRLTRQMLSEGLLLALAGGAAGLLLSTWATHTIQASLFPMLPVALSLPHLDLDWRVLVATVGFSVMATLVFGAGPAWTLAGGATAADLERHTGVERWQRLRGVRIGNTLVIGQVALSLLLLASGGLFLTSAISAASADPGFRLDGGLVVQVDPGLAGYDDAQSRALHRALVSRLQEVPGVESVTIGSGLPFSSTEDSRRVAPAGTSGERSQHVDAVFNAVGRDYARTLGVPTLRGRDFTEAELAPGSSEPVAIIDDALAQRLWPDEDALGRSIEFADARGAERGRSMRIVGIITAVKHSFGNPRPSSHVYVPLGQHDESAMTLQIRVAGESERTMLATVGRVIRDVDVRIPVLRLATWRDHLDQSFDIWLYRTGASVFVAFGAIALLLAVIGVYGVKSYVVSRRTREFGIRIATGAHPRLLLWQVLREGGGITVIGVGIGLLLALGAGRILRGFLYEVNAVEPLVLVTAPLILLAASLAASFVPARRATKVDPMVALRAE